MVESLDMLDCVCWMCPVCDWLITSVEKDMIICNPDCPGCGCRKYSEFVLVAGFLDLGETHG